MRISKPVVNTQLSVIRGILGTKRKTHAVNDIVERIKIYPIEFRRNSIIRASGHTFEYLGFGPGNYSTGLPERQDRILSPKEEVLSQSTKIDGGTILYSAMNSDGDFYNNNRKLTSTGKDQIFETPIPTVSGEEPLELLTDGGYNLMTPAEIIVSRSIKISGGSESNIISEFNGPVIFDKKISSNSEDGIEVRKISLKGDLEISRDIGISTSLPITSGTVGDVVFNASPNKNENIGWVYTTEDKWEKFGWVNDELYGINAGTVDDIAPPFSKTLTFAGSGINVTSNFDSSTGITTITLAQTLEAANQIGLVTGTNTTVSPPDWETSGTFNSEYQVPVIKFVGSDLGFGFNVSTEYGFVNGIGIGTVKFESPLRPLNFGTPADYPSPGLGSPTNNALSIGTRIILENSLSPSQTNYAIGRVNDDIWISTRNYGGLTPSGYRFFAGTTQLGYFSSSDAGTVLQIEGDISLIPKSGSPSNNGTIRVTGQLISTVAQGTEPVSVGSSTLCTDFNTQYVGGYPVNTVTVGSLFNKINTIPVRQFHTSGSPQAYDGVSVASGQVVLSGITTGLVDRDGIGRNGAFYQNIQNITGFDVFRRSGDYSSGLSTFTNICEITNPVSTTLVSSISSGTATIDYRLGAVARYSGGGISIAFSTINLTNVPGSASGISATQNRSFNFTLIVEVTSGTSNLPTAITIGGVSPTSTRWLNGVQPTSSGNGPGTYVIGYTVTIIGSTTSVLAVYSTYS